MSLLPPIVPEVSLSCETVHQELSFKKLQGGTRLFLLSASVWIIELNIRTRGRTDDTACTNAKGPQGDTRAICALK